MTARDALARIQARSTSPWNVADIGEMRTHDVPALVEATTAVLDVLDDLRRAHPDPAPYTTEATVIDRLAAVETVILGGSS